MVSGAQLCLGNIHPTPPLAVIRHLRNNRLLKKSTVQIQALYRSNSVEWRKKVNGSSVAMKNVTDGGRNASCILNEVYF